MARTSMSRESRTWALALSTADELHAHTNPVTTLSKLCLAYSSLGVIYGDIGTSPLYVFDSVFESLPADKDNVVMVMSLIFWSLTLVVLLKYMLVVMRADDHGEGGTFAIYSRLCRSLGVSAYGTMQADEHKQLLTLSRSRELSSPSLLRGSRSSLRHRSSGLGGAPPLASPSTGRRAVPHDAAASRGAGEEHAHGARAGQWWQWGALPADGIKRWFQGSLVAQRTLLFTTVFTTAMVLGDGVLTPAISVVSAVSGLKQASDQVTSDIMVGVSIAILVLLFAFQFKGTSQVSAVFSPIVLLWLVANAAMGVYQLVRVGGGIFQALSPHHIVRFFEAHGSEGWAALGAVMLCITGAEAMFADLGHFTAGSIQLGFGAVVYPCLVLTYLGQGAMLMHDLDAIGSTYWTFVPTPVFWPMLVLATLTSVVASQALISAAFSICRQAMVLGVFPKLKVTHTSETAEGQIYIGPVNWLLMALVVACVAGFNGDTVKLGNAYGLTISAVMLVTTLLVGLVMVVDWHVGTPLVAAFVGAFALIEGAFLSANCVKIPHGGWFALLVAACVAAVNTIWWAGQRQRRHALALYDRLTPGDVFTVLRQNNNHKGDNGGGLGYSSSSAAVGQGSSHVGHKGGPWGAVAESATHQPASGKAGGMATAGTGAAAWDLQRLSASSGATTPHGSGESPATATFRGAGDGEHDSWGQAGCVGPPGPVAEASEELMRGGREGEARASAPTLVASPDAPGHAAAPAWPSAETELQLLQGHARLALCSSPNTPLVVLPGLALYYTPDLKGLPSVLRHFMRNVEAIHTVNVCVMVRFLPLPHVPEEERLLVRAMPQLPMFYQAMVRYGYLDAVDHGPGFVDELVNALVAWVEARAGSSHEEPPLPDLEREPSAAASAAAAVAAASAPVASLAVVSPSSQVLQPHQLLPYPSLPAHAEEVDSTDEQQYEQQGTSPAQLGVQGDGGSVEIRIAPVEGTMGGEGGGSAVTGGHEACGVPLLRQAPSMRLEVPFEGPRASVDIGRLSRNTRSSLQRIRSRGWPAGGSSSTQYAPTAFARMLAVREAAHAVMQELPGTRAAGAQEVAALRLEALLRAASAGVVYYFGATKLRMTPGSSLAHDVLFGYLYAPMLVLAAADNEAWRVPINNLVELGMVLHV